MNTEIKVDVLAVMDYAAETFRRLNKASPEDHRLDIEDAEQARLAVAELVEAARKVIDAAAMDPRITDTSATWMAADKMRAALAKFEGAA